MSCSHYIYVTLELASLVVTHYYDATIDSDSILVTGYKNWAVNYGIFTNSVAQCISNLNCFLGDMLYRQ